MNCLVRARNVPNTAVRAAVTNMRCFAACIPTEKETRPTVVMHRHRRPGRNADFEHAYKPVFENHLVTLGRSLYRIEAVGKTGFVLSIGSETQDQESE